MRQVFWILVVPPSRQVCSAIAAIEELAVGDIPDSVSWVSPVDGPEAPSEPLRGPFGEYPGSTM